VLLKKLIWIEM